MQSNRSTRLIIVGAAWLILLFLHLGLVAPSRGFADDRKAKENAKEIGKRLLGTLQGSSGETVAFSPNGKLIVTAGDWQARVWNAQTFKPVTPPLQYERKVRKAAFSPDSKRILVVGIREAHIYNAKSGKRRVTLAHQKPLFDAAFSPDGKQVVTASLDVRIWDSTSGKLLRTMKHGADLPFVCFSPRGDKVFAASYKLASPGYGFIWDVHSGSQLPGRFSEAQVRSYGSVKRNVGVAAFSPDGKKLVTVGCRSAPIWKVKTREEIASAKAEFQSHLQSIASVAFSPDGANVLVTEYDTIRLFDARTGGMVKQIEDYGYIEFASFTADGKRIYGSSSSGRSGMWDAETGKRLITLSADQFKHAHEKDLSDAPAVGVNADGTRIAASWRKGNFTLIWAVPK